MTFCCAEKAFKLLAQIGAICHRQTVTVLTPKPSCRKPQFCPIFVSEKCANCTRKMRQNRHVENRFFVRFLRQNFRISIRKWSVLAVSLCFDAILDFFGGENHLNLKLKTLLNQLLNLLQLSALTLSLKRNSPTQRDRCSF